MKRIREKEPKIKEKRTRKGNSALPVAFVIAIVIGVVAYFAMLRGEENALSNYEKTAVYVANQDIVEDTVITEANASEYFKVLEIADSILPADALYDLNDIYGKAPYFTISTNTAVTQGMFYSINDIYSNLSDPQQIGLSVSDSAQFINGIIRTGDYVDIYIFQKASTQSTLDDISSITLANSKPSYTKVYVSEALDAAGKKILNSDTTSITQRINIVMEGSDAAKVYNALQSGTLYISKNITASN